MSEYNLGTAKGTIEIDYKGTGADRANEDLKGTSKHASSADESLRKTGNSAGIAGLAIAAGLGLAVKSATDFEKGLSGIQAVSGATTSEMDAVRKKALQLGADTQFSASESSMAIEELVKAGIAIPDVLNGAADATVALAAAGGVALPEAATIAANAMNQFGLSSKELPAVVDRIAGAANTSAIDVTDLGMSMAQAGAVANLTGLSFDDTALAIAAMGNAGIKGSDAGTSLKSMLMGLQPVTDKQIGLMKDLGLVTKDGANQFYDAQGKVKSMAEIGGVLEGALKGMTDAQKTATLETLFGSDAIRAAAVIADTGAAGFAKMNTEMNKTSAADVAKTRMNNLSGQIEQLKGSAETLAIQLGTVLVPLFKNIVTAITQAVNWFTNLDSGTQKTIVTVAAIAAGVLLFVSALIKMVQFAKAAKLAMIALNATFLTNPIFLIIMAIIALVAGIVLLYKKNETFRNFINKAWAGIKAAISSVVTWITGTAVPWLVNAWNSIVAGAKWLWNMIKTVFMAIVMAVTLPMRLIIAAITAALSFILGIWKALWGLFGPLVKAVWDLIKAIIQVAFAWIMVFIRTYLNMLKAFWTAIWNAIKTVVMTVFNAIKAGIARVMNGIRAVIQAIWGKIGGTVMGAVNRIKSVVTSVFNAIKGVATRVWGSLSSVIGEKINAAKEKVKTAIDTIKGFFSGAGTWLKEAGRRIIQGLIDGITGMVDKVSGAISGIADKIRGFLPGSPIKEGPLRDHGWNSGTPGKKLAESLAGGLESGLPMVQKLLEGLSGDVSVGIGSNGVAVAGSAARTASSASTAAAAGAPTALRMVSGTMGIDPSGRAWIQGVAQEVVENDKSYAGTTGRMSGY